MNHLKLFENYQEDVYNKHIINILGDFSYRLEQILISVSTLTPSKHTYVRRKTHDSNNIDITFYVHKLTKLLKINLDIKDELFYIKIKLYNQSRIIVSINVEDHQKFNFRYVDDITIDDIKQYNLDDALIDASHMKKQYPDRVFDIIPFEELELEMNANKYNL